MDNKMELGLPEKLQMHHRGTHLEFIRRWFGWHVIPLTGFALFWDGFLVAWYAMAFKGGSGQMQWIMLLFPLLHVSVGVGLSYFVAATWVNRTHILVGGGKLSVRHRPIPWFGNLEVPAATLKQLYVSEKISHSRNGSSVSFAIHAITQDGRDKKLISGLPEREQALYLEQEIEKYLGIKDTPVKGELGGSD